MSTVLILIGRRPASRGGGEPGEDVGEPVAAGDLGEALRAQRVERDVDPVEPGGGEPGRAAGSPSPLVVTEISGRGLERRGRGDDVLEPAAQQRLAAGEADLADAEALDGDARPAGRPPRR